MGYLVCCSGGLGWCSGGDGVKNNWYEHRVNNCFSVVVMNLNEDAVVALLLCAFTWFFGLTIFLLRNEAFVNAYCERFWECKCSRKWCCFVVTCQEEDVGDVDVV